MKKKNFFSLVVLLFLILSIPLSVYLVQQVQIWWQKATSVPANIVVDTKAILGPMPQVWQALAQGGEEDENMLAPVISETRALSPKYIRIDHIYDFYDVVRKENERLTFHWEQLDKVVNQILKTGALPFFSLSYMPTTIAQNGDIIAPPTNWEDWSVVVQQTIQHYSGRSGYNLNNVVYEVWNEPDLFGDWKIGGEKDYRLLYKYAVLGANQAKNINPFKIGGPAITAPYKTWIDGFLDYIKDNNLRIDFYSWHRYSLDPEKFLEDVNAVDTWLFQNAGYSLEKYLTEWGSASENSPYHDSNFDAAHLVATVRQLIHRVDLAFIFEIKDGLSPEGKKYWGRWGLLTHEKAGSIEKKPKYLALQLLNKMNGNRISLQGEGTWVTGFASKEENKQSLLLRNKIKIILVNFDQNSRHFEQVPLTINNLENGNYSYKESFLAGVSKTSTETITTGALKKEIPLSANNIVFIELTKI